MREWPQSALSRELSLATDVAKVFMLRRRASRLGLADFVAGLYVADLGRISKYWKSPITLDQLAIRCGVADPRWTYQHEYYHLMTKRNSPILNRPILYDSDFVVALRQAEKLAKQSKRAADIPTITIEHMLLAIVASSKNSLCAEIVRSGLAAQRVANHLKKTSPA